jgi:hypothetical protein
MIAAVCLEAVALVAVVWMLVRSHAADQRAWVEERRELLERIQRPERIPAHLPEAYEIPEFQPDDFDMVGTISHLDTEA